MKTQIFTSPEFTNHEEWHAIFYLQSRRVHWGFIARLNLNIKPKLSLQSFTSGFMNCPNCICRADLHNCGWPKVLYSKKYSEKGTEKAYIHACMLDLPLELWFVVFLNTQTDSFSFFCLPFCDFWYTNFRFCDRRRNCCKVNEGEICADVLFRNAGYSHHKSLFAGHIID